MAGRILRGNLPVELTSFVGRRRELAEVKRLLADARLMTLTGIGGTGKTRLALRAGGDLRRALPDGVWFVDLTVLRTSGRAAGEVEDPEVLAHLVAAVLGLHDRPGMRPVQRLIDHLADRQTLLLLDNCEHLLPACAAMVDRLLRNCPGLRILATSREPLAVTGEQIFPVPPLPTPRLEEQQTLSGLGRYESVTLFVARAQAAMPSFDLTTGNQAAVAEICHRLDGLPLAIELAAARLRVLSPEQILDRLADRFAVLGRGSRMAPGRQQTLRACVDWSFDLCSKPERMLWARLAVFVGGFELDAVEGVCADEELPVEDLLDLVAALVDKSILVRDDSGGGSEAARYQMLETIRGYGHEQLREAGDYELLHRRHADWYQRLVARASAEWISHREAYWQARMTREHPNLRAAINYCLDDPGQADTALHLVTTVPLSYWSRRGLFSEVRRWMDRALTQIRTPSAVRARALLLDSHYAIIQGDGEVGMRLLDIGEDLARRLGSTVELAYATYVRGVVRLYRGDLVAAITAMESTQQILSTVPQPESGLAPELRLCQLLTLGLSTGLVGDNHRADSCLADVLAITEACGETHFRYYALWAQALSAWGQGKVHETVTSLVAALRLRQADESTDRSGVARCIEMMAWVTANQQQYQRAATLLGAADALWTGTGQPIAVQGHMIGPHEECDRLTRAGLGEAAFTDAVARGQSLSYHDAIAAALDEQRHPKAQPSPEAPNPLTRRERQVAALIAEGLSNKEIAAKLVIAQRTAESHVEHILTKLGATSRAQVAAWNIDSTARDGS